MRLAYLILSLVPFLFSDSLFCQSDSVQEANYKKAVRIADSLGRLGFLREAQKEYQNALKMSPGNIYLMQQVRNIQVELNAGRCKMNEAFVDSLFRVQDKQELFTIYSSCVIGRPDFAALKIKLDLFFSICNQEEKKIYLDKLINLSDTCLVLRSFYNGQELVNYVGTKEKKAEAALRQKFQHKVDSVKFFDTYPPVEYYPGGEIKVIRQYYDFKSYFVKTFYQNGAVERTGEVKNGINSGPFLEYYQSGKTHSRRHYLSNGTCDSMIRWDENNNLTEMQIIKVKKGGKVYSIYGADGVLNEVRTEKGNAQKVIRYNMIGKKEREENYVDGKLTGDYMEYSPNGKLIVARFYKDGLLNGISKEYYPDGKLKSSGQYKKGIEYGKFMSYFENGKINCSRNYVKGEVSEEQCFDRNGMPLQIMH